MAPISWTMCATRWKRPIFPRGLGLGGKLLDAAMKHAEAQDWSSVYLETTDGLEASMALYRKLGFEMEIAEDRPLWHGGGRFLQMRRSL